MTPVQPNGTDAKEIAFHFIEHTSDGRVTPAIISKTIVQAKSILKAGYTKEEVMSVIDYVVKRNPNIYSMGYISHCINDVLRHIEQESVKEKAKEVRQELEKTQAEARKAVQHDGESTERNKRKARQLGVQSRKREKFNFNMFEE